MDICDLRFPRLSGVGSRVCVQWPQPHTLLDETMNEMPPVPNIYIWVNKVEDSRPFRFINEVMIPFSTDNAQSFNDSSWDRYPCRCLSPKVRGPKSLMFWTVTTVNPCAPGCHLPHHVNLHIQRNGFVKHTQLIMDRRYSFRRSTR